MQESAVSDRRGDAEGGEKVTRVLGIDPDTRGTGWAIVEDGKVVQCGVLDITELYSKKVKGREAAVCMAGTLVKFCAGLPPMTLAVIEGQQVYRSGKADANNLLLLALVSGAAAGACVWKAAATVVPRPKDWKGQQPKGVNQARSLNRLHWVFEFDGPDKPVKNVEFPEGVLMGQPKASHLKEVVDAIGLALWGYDQVIS